MTEHDAQLGIQHHLYGFNSFICLSLFISSSGSLCLFASTFSTPSLYLFLLIVMCHYHISRCLSLIKLSGLTWWLLDVQKHNVIKWTSAIKMSNVNWTDYPSTVWLLAINTFTAKFTHTMWPKVCGTFGGMYSVLMLNNSVWGQVVWWRGITKGTESLQKQCFLFLTPLIFLSFLNTVRAASSVWCVLWGMIERLDRSHVNAALVTADTA